MAKALEFEKADELGNPIKRLAVGSAATPHPPRKARIAKKPRINMTEAIVSSDEGDLNYEATEPVESGTLLSEGDDVLPSNAEVCYPVCLIISILTRTNIPVGGRNPAIQDNPHCGVGRFWKAHAFKAKAPGPFGLL